MAKGLSLVFWEAMVGVFERSPKALDLFDLSDPGDRGDDDMTSPWIVQIMSQRRCF